MLFIGGGRSITVRAQPGKISPADRMVRGASLVLAGTLVFLAPFGRAQSQDSPADSVETNVVTSRPSPPKRPPAQDIAVEGGGSFGHYRIFAGGSDSKQYIGGVEYDRNSWGTFLKARMDYSAELLPIMRLNEPATTDIWGDVVGPGRKIIYGAGFSPIGFRMIWGRHAVRPFFSAKAGLDVWNHKFMTRSGSYEQFTLHESIGALIKMTDRYDLRVDIGDFHQSNGFMTDINPGLDVASYNAAIVYHLGSGRAGVR